MREQRDAHENEAGPGDQDQRAGNPHKGSYFGSTEKER